MPSTPMNRPSRNNARNSVNVATVSMAPSSTVQSPSTPFIRKARSCSGLRLAIPSLLTGHPRISTSTMVVAFAKTVIASSRTFVSLSLTERMRVRSARCANLSSSNSRPRKSASITRPSASFLNLTPSSSSAFKAFASSVGFGFSGVAALVSGASFFSPESVQPSEMVVSMITRRARVYFTRLISQWKVCFQNGGTV